MAQGVGTRTAEAAHKGAALRRFNRLFDCDWQFLPCWVHARQQAVLQDVRRHLTLLPFTSLPPSRRRRSASTSTSRCKWVGRAGRGGAEQLGA